jgi:phosphoglycerol transferase MdoB-like AlkP superfamily enzyme
MVFLVSKSPSELLSKLSKDSLNIIYAAAYIRIIQSRWKKEGFSINEKPEIIGTLYSTGLFYNNGEERIPGKNPKSNFFGDKVKKAAILFENF